jgi:hypothetical protein
MTQAVLARKWRADALWSEVAQAVDVSVELNVVDWRDLPRFERTLPVGGHGDLAVSLKVFVWFGGEEDLGDGDDDFADVFLGVSIGLTEQDGRRCESVLDIQGVSGKELAAWHAEPSFGAPTGFHNLWRSVSGLFGRQRFHLRLRPEELPEEQMQAVSAEYD